jgi:hypothetical protein
MGPFRFFAYFLPIRLPVWLLSEPYMTHIWSFFIVFCLMHAWTRSQSIKILIMIVHGWLGYNYNGNARICSPNHGLFLACSPIVLEYNWMSQLILIFSLDPHCATDHSGRVV